MGATEGAAACKKVTEVILYVALGLTVLGIAAGLFYLPAPCDMKLAEWNLINGILSGVLAFTAFFALQVSPKTLDLAYRTAMCDCSLKELMSESLLPASLACGLLLVPALLFIWSIHGLIGASYGTCGNTLPELYFLSVVEMLAVLGGFAAADVYVLQAADITLEKIMAKCKEMCCNCIDCAKGLCCSACTLLKTAFETVYVHTVVALEWIKRTVCSCCCWTHENVTKVWNERPLCLKLSYWRGEESRPLLG